MSVLADRGLVSPLRPVPAGRPESDGVAPGAPVPVRREPGSAAPNGGPARRRQSEKRSGESTRKDDLRDGLGGEVVELRGRTAARRQPSRPRGAWWLASKPLVRRATPTQSATPEVAGGASRAGGSASPVEADPVAVDDPILIKNGEWVSAGAGADLSSLTITRGGERVGHRTSAPSAVEADAPARDGRRASVETVAPPREDRPAKRGRTPVRHRPAAVPANPGRTARDRRGESVRPPSRAQVVEARQGGTACRSSARPSVRWPWLFAIAFAACLFVTGLGVFGASMADGPVPSRTESVSVQPGDSLSALAARFAPHADQSAVVARIKQLNGLDDTALQPGMPITVPVDWPDAAANGSAAGR